MPLIPEFRRHRQVDLCEFKAAWSIKGVPRQPGLHRERHCLRKQEPKPNQETRICLIIMKHDFHRKYSFNEKYFSLFCCLGTPFIDQAALNSQRSTCLCLRNSGIKGMRHHLPATLFSFVICFVFLALFLYFLLHAYV